MVVRRTQGGSVTPTSPAAPIKSATCLASSALAPWLAMRFGVQKVQLKFHHQKDAQTDLMTRPSWSGPEHPNPHWPRKQKQKVGHPKCHRPPCHPNIPNPSKTTVFFPNFRHLGPTNIDTAQPPVLHQLTLLENVNSPILTGCTQKIRQRPAVVHDLRKLHSALKMVQELWNEHYWKCFSFENATNKKVRFYETPNFVCERCVFCLHCFFLLQRKEWGLLGESLVWMTPSIEIPQAKVGMPGLAHLDITGNPGISVDIMASSVL